MHHCDVTFQHYNSSTVQVRFRVLGVLGGSSFCAVLHCSIKAVYISMTVSVPLAFVALEAYQYVLGGSNQVHCAPGLYYVINLFLLRTGTIFMGHGRHRGRMRWFGCVPIAA